MIRLLILAYLSLLLLGLSDNMRGPLYPEILQEFQLSDSVGSWFFSISSIFGFIGGTFSSFWIRRFGSVRTLQLAILVCGLAQWGMASATSFPLLLSAVIFFGWSLSTMGVVQNFLVVTESPEKLRNRLVTGLHSMYALASLLAPLIVHWLSTQNLQTPVWRESFLWGAFCSLLVLGYSLTLKSKTRTPQAFSGLEKSEGFAQQVYFAVAVSSYVLAEVLLSARLAQYLRMEFSYGLAESSLATAGFFVCLLAGRVLFSFWSPPISLEKQLFSFLGLATVSLLLGLWVHPVGLVLTGFMMGPFYPLMMVEAGKLFRGCLDQAISITVGLSASFVVLMHISFGWLNDHFGISFGFYLAPLFCLISFAMLGAREKIFRQL